MAAPRQRINMYVGPKIRIKREDLPQYEATGDWVAEIKWDGEWGLFTVHDGIVVGLDSRTGLPLGGNLVKQIVAKSSSGQMCGELVSDKIHLFDIYNWNGMDLRDLPLEDRREALEMVHGTLQEWSTCRDRILLVERRNSGFLAWYDQLMAGKSKLRGAHAEGLVLKKKGSPLRATNADGKVEFQIRCKPLSTVDYVVIGPDGTAAKGTPKIALGLYDGGTLKKCMSPTWPAGMDLRPGMVVEVEGAEVWPSGAVRHGHIRRVRTDKDPLSCTVEAAIAA